MSDTTSLGGQEESYKILTQRLSLENAIVVIELLDAVKRLSEGKPIRDLDERILHAEKLIKEVLGGEKE